MEHKNRWLNRTRLYVTKLEDRVTPSTLNGLDLGDLALPDDQPALKRPKTNDTVNVENSALAVVNQVSGPNHVSVARQGTTQANHQTTNTTANPVIRPPQQTQGAIGKRGDITIARDVAETRFYGGATRIDLNGRLGVTPGVPTGKTITTNAEQRPGGNYDPRVPVSLQVSYGAEGTKRDDGINAVAPDGAGGFYTCGWGGRSGQVRHYDATGALLAGPAGAKVFAPGTLPTNPVGEAPRLQLNDCVVSGGFLYVTGTQYSDPPGAAPSYPWSNFNHRILAGLGGVVLASEYDGSGANFECVAQDTSFLISTDGVDKLTGITVNAGAVYTTGTLNVGGQDDVADFHQAAAPCMGPVGAGFSGWTLGAGIPTNGYSAVSDAAGTRWYGVDVDVVKDAGFFAVDALDAIPVPWGGIYGIGCDVPTGGTDNGMHGLAFDGAANLLLGGTTQEGVFNPGFTDDPTQVGEEFDAIIEGSVTSSIGAAPLLNGGFCYVGTGTDWSAQGAAYDPINDDLLTAGWFNDFPGSGSKEADTSAFDNTGFLYSFIGTRTFGDIALDPTVPGDADLIQNDQMFNLGVAVSGTMAWSGGVTNVDNNSMEEYGNDFIAINFPPSLAAGHDSCFGTPAAVPPTVCNGPAGDGGPPADGHYIGDTLVGGLGSDF